MSDEPEVEGICDWCGEPLSCEDYDGMCAMCAFDCEEIEDREMGVDEDE